MRSSGRGRRKVVQPTRELILRVLDLVPVCVFVVNSEGRVLVKNESARILVEKEDGLRLDSGRLRALKAEETAVLREYIGRAARRSGDGVPWEGALPLSRSPGRNILAVLVCSLGPTAGSRDRLAAVLVSDPNNLPEPDPERLRALYQLTPAEADVAVQIAKGRRLHEVAETFGVSINTVRTHVRQLFLKTSTKRQAELVRLLICGPALMRIR